ncbi:hypothetical protein H8E07_15350 [bacterium]|nr:hypothetical protein [bacterium]
MRRTSTVDSSHRLPTGRLVLLLCAVWAAAAGAQVVLPTPELPPEPDPARCDLLISLYAGVGVHAVFPGPIVLSDPIHRCFQNVMREDDGSGNEIETFDSILNAKVELGFGNIPIELTGPVETVVFGRTGNTTGTFDTEIVSMSLTGNIGGQPVEIRESPTHASPGQTTITDLGGGQFQIDSFFDVFTEVSVAGSPFMPAADSGRMVLVPAESVIPVETTSTWGAIKDAFR